MGKMNHDRNQQPHTLVAAAPQILYANDNVPQNPTKSNRCCTKSCIAATGFTVLLCIAGGILTAINRVAKLKNPKNDVDLRFTKKDVKGIMVMSALNAFDLAIPPGEQSQAARRFGLRHTFEGEVKEMLSTLYISDEDIIAYNNWLNTNGPTPPMENCPIIKEISKFLPEDEIVRLVIEAKATLDGEAEPA